MKRAECCVVTRRRDEAQTVTVFTGLLRYLSRPTSLYGFIDEAKSLVLIIVIFRVIYFFLLLKSTQNLVLIVKL